MQNHEYPEYGINVISLNYVINELVEPEVMSFCWAYNLGIRSNSRDVKKIITHFIANSVISVCKKFNNTKNILNFTPLKLVQLDESMTTLVGQCVVNIIKRFGFCHVALEQSIDVLNLTQIYELKAISDRCYIKPKSLEKLKRYLSSHDFIKLHADITNNIVLRSVLAK